MEKRTIFSEILDSYKDVIIHSLITSFGLDFVVKDNVGGDVDTIHNVRNGVDFKNQTNKARYDNRGTYDPAKYHNHPTYLKMIDGVRNQGCFDDMYVPGNRIAYGKQSILRQDTTHKANLDHIIPGKEIFDDPGVYLANLDGVELANDPSNLGFTNEKLNKSKGEMSNEEYIKYRELRGDPLSNEEKEAMRMADKRSRREYNKKLNNYYLSQQFMADAVLAAGKVGVKMGIRQAVGFVFLEIWKACEIEIKALPPKTNIKDSFEAISKGIKTGFENAKNNCKQLFIQFGEGLVAGVMASLSTTLINAFLTTSVTFGRIIRQGFVTVVQAGKILLFNPYNERLGDQLKRASVSIVMGGSVIAGILVSAPLEKLLLPVPAPISAVIKDFVSLLVSGLVSCTLLVIIDRSKFIANVLSKLNKYCSYDVHLDIVCESFDKIACEIKGFSFEELNNELRNYDKLINELENKNDEEINKLLLSFYKDNEIPLPWEGDFNEFMSNSKNKLKF